MSARASHFRIGIFVVVGAAILGIALFLFGIRSAFERMYHFETYVTGDSDGLSKGSAVKLRGVTVGKVTEIGFSWRLYDNASPRCQVSRTNPGKLRVRVGVRICMQQVPKISVR